MKEKGVKVLKVFRGFAKKRGSLVLTIISVVGTIVTAFLSAKFARKADEDIQRAKENKAMAEAKEGEQVTEETVAKTQLTFKEKTIIRVKAFAPAIIAAAITVASALGSHFVSAREISDLLAGANVANTVHEKFMKKTEEVVGKEKADEIRKEANAELAKESTSRGASHSCGRGGVQWYYLPLSNDWFEATPDDIRLINADLCDRVNSGDCEVYGYDGQYITLDDVYDAFNQHIKGAKLPTRDVNQYIKISVRSAEGKMVTDLISIDESKVDEYGYVYGIIDLQDRVIEEY